MLAAPPGDELERAVFSAFDHLTFRSYAMRTTNPARSRLATLLQSAGHILLLGPRAVADGVAVLGGRPDAALARQRALAGSVSAPSGPPGAARPLAHAALSLALWVPALILLGVFVLALLRGLLYGLVDDGPYDNAWGGPTRAGAWAMHALVALLPFAAVALGVRGLAALHIRVTRRLLGASDSGWAIPVALLAAAAGALLVVAWSRQI